MADPLSVLGGISAAGQLAENGGQIIKFACNLYKQYQDPSKTQRQLEQVNQVSGITVSHSGSSASSLLMLPAQYYSSSHILRPKSVSINRAFK
jgi:hypothetical protein